MYKDIENIDLDKTLLGGQTHSWDKIGSKYIGFTQSGIIEINTKNNSIYSSINAENYITNYFNLDKDIDKIKLTLSEDRIIKNAIDANPNLRVLKQDFEENLLMFILTQHKNIKAIRKSLRLLLDKFGSKDTTSTRILFPSTETIAEASISELNQTGIGFRSKYLKSSAQRLLDTKLIERIYKLSEEEAREELKEFYGVGDKVADCVLSFSLGFDNVTPLDVWSIRALKDLYKLPDTYSYEDMRKWTQDKWDGYAAWAGHFLWEWYRDLKMNN